MTRLTCFAILLGIFSLPVAVLDAAAFYDLRDASIELIDEVASFDLTEDGIIATLTANTGLLNRTASAFGVNAAGTGDDTDTLDDGSGVIESVTITFDTDVRFNQLQLSLLTAPEDAAVSTAVSQERASRTA